MCVIVVITVFKYFSVFVLVPLVHFTLDLTLSHYRFVNYRNSGNFHISIDFCRRHHLAI